MPGFPAARCMGLPADTSGFSASSHLAVSQLTAVPELTPVTSYTGNPKVWRCVRVWAAFREGRTMAAQEHGTAAGLDVVPDLDPATRDLDPHLGPDLELEPDAAELIRLGAPGPDLPGRLMRRGNRPLASRAVPLLAPPRFPVARSGPREP